MKLNEDTFTGDWRFDLKNHRDLVSVTFSGFNGNTVFDRTNPSPGTAGSRDGLDGDVRNACFAYYRRTDTRDCVNFGTTSVRYFNEVSLNGAPPVGDLFESVFIDFSNVTLTGPQADGGLDEDYSEFYLLMDTDNARLSRVAVPEPSSVALLAAGSLGIFGAARRRRNR